MVWRIKLVLALTLMLNPMQLESTRSIRSIRRPLSRRQRKLQLSGGLAVGLGAVGGMAAGGIIAKLFGNKSDAVTKLKQISLDFSLETGKMLQGAVDRGQSVTSIKRLTDQIRKELWDFERQSVTIVQEIKAKIANEGQKQTRSIRKMEEALFPSKKQ